MVELKIIKMIIGEKGHTHFTTSLTNQELVKNGLNCRWMYEIYGKVIKGKFRLQYPFIQHYGKVKEEFQLPYLESFINCNAGFKLITNKKGKIIGAETESFKVVGLYDQE